MRRSDRKYLLSQKERRTIVAEAIFAKLIAHSFPKPMRNI